MVVVLPAPVWPTMATVWPGSTRKETSRRTQSSSLGLAPAAIGEGDVAELDFAAHDAELASRADGRRRQRLVEQLENAFGGGHGRLQDIELVAQVLNGLEESLRVLHEGDEHADGHHAGQRSQAAVPEDGNDGDDAEEFDGGIETGRTPGWRLCRLPCARG